MADDIFLTIGVETKGILTAIKTTTTLKNNIEKLIKARERNQINDDQLDASLKKLAKNSGAYGKQVDGVTKSILAANKAQKEAAAAAKQAKEEDKAFAQARREAIAINKEFDRQKKQEAEETARAAAEQERLNRKFVEGHAAMEIYSRELNDLAMALEAKIITDVQQKAAVAKLNQEMAAGTGVFSTFGRGVNQTKGYTNQFGLVTQQVGYQVGDLAVQVQSGTNFFVAFGQQMTQLAGLGAQLSKSMAMIGVFTGLGIAIPIITGILAYMTRTTEETEKTVDVFQKLAEVTKELGLERRKATDSSFDENLVGTKDRLQELTESYQSAKKVAEDFAEASRVASQSGIAAGGMGQALGYEAMGQALVQIATLDFDFNKEQTSALALIEAEKELVRYKGERADAQARLAQESITELNTQIELNRVILKYGEDSLQVKQKQAELDKRAFINEQLKSGITGKELSRVLAVYETSVKLANVTEASVALQEAAAQLRITEAQAYADTVAEADKLKDSIGQAYLDSLGLAQVPMEVGIDKAAEAARLLAERLGISLTQAQNIINLAAAYAPAEGQTRPKPRPPNLRTFIEPDYPTSDNGVGTGSAPSDPLADLMKRIELEKELLGTSEEYQEVMQAIQGSDKKYSEAAIQGAVARVEALNKEKELLEQMKSQHKEIGDVLRSSMTEAFMSMVDGTKSVKDAFKDMARAVIAQLYEILVVKQMVNSIAGAFGFADGGAFSGGRQIQAYANGGIVGGPTYFPMAGGKTGLMGEAGPEAIMPLKRGKGGKLGVSVEGNSGSVNVVNNINVTGGSDPAAIRAEVAKLMPQITSATKSAVIDARKRGGKMKAAFQ
jgi:hypothetical protein